jgi:hypothetical protein
MFRSLSNPEPAASTTTSSGVLHSLVCRHAPRRAAASRSATPSGRAGGNGLYSLVCRAPCRVRRAARSATPSGRGAGGNGLYSLVCRAPCRAAPRGPLPLAVAARGPPWR